MESVGWCSSQVHPMKERKRGRGKRSSERVKMIPGTWNNGGAGKSSARYKNGVVSSFSIDNR